MHRSGLGGIIIDCQTDDPERAARFWSKALGYGIKPRAPDGDPDYVELDVPEGRPYIEVQRVAHPSRVHLDIKTDDLDAEVSRLEQLGARALERIKHWCVMEAPSGQRFCVVQLYAGEERGALNCWE